MKGPSESAGGPMHTSSDSFDGVGISEFLELDVNPAVVLDLRGRCLAFENSAFQQWKSVHPQDADAFVQPSFVDRALETSKNVARSEFNVAGGKWCASLLRKRWMVITCTNVAPTGLPTPPVIDPSTSLGGSSQSDAAQENLPRAASDSQRSSIATGSPSAPSSTDTFAPFSRLLDWTKYNVNGLSAHVIAVKTFPWHTTPVGSIDSWSDVLRATVIAMNANTEARILLWGPQRTMIYNEACAPLFGQKYPLAMGGRPEDIWAEAWPALYGFVARAETEGRATRLANIPLTMHRHGYDEETFWIANFVPVIGSKGKTLGVIDEFTETTMQVVPDRRRDIVLKISEALARVNTSEELWDVFLQGIQRAEDDIPFAGIYVPTDSTHNNPTGLNTPFRDLHRFSLRGLIGVQDGAKPLPDGFDLNSTRQVDELFIKACREAWKSGGMVAMNSEDGSLSATMAVSVPGRAGGYQVKTVCVVPIPDLIGDHQLAFLVLALTPRRPFDTNANTFVNSLGDVLTRSASAIFLPDEQRRTRQRFEEIEVSLSQRLEATSLEAERVEARYEKLINQIPIGIFTISAQEKLLYHNDAYLNFTGTTIEYAKSDERLGNLVDDRDHARVLKLWKLCIETKQPFTTEYRVKKEWRSVDPSTGKEISGDTWILASASPDLDDNGSVHQVTGWLLDISDRKYHEKINLQRLDEEKAEARFARLAETAPMGMFLLKPNGVPMYLNDAYYDLKGYSREGFKDSEAKFGRGWEAAIHEDDRDMVNESWKRLAEQGISASIEYRVNKPWKTYDSASGTEITGPTWLQSTGFAERDDEGKITAVQGFVSEISMKKFSERLLSERLEEALENKRSADRFIDMTSHEMRNPLSAILQSADGILTAVTADQTDRSLSLDHYTPYRSDDMIETVIDSAQTIVLCAQHQKRIVDDILTLSKLDSNLLTISPDKSHVPGLIQRCFKMYEAELERTEIDVALEIEDGYRDMLVHNVMLDSSRVLQVIINLLTNAIKFTQHAASRTITIFLDASKTRPDGLGRNIKYIDRKASRPDLTSSPDWGEGEVIFLQVAVQDSGKGLNDEELKLLFRRFSQASPKTYKQYGGSGLGLFISRELTELQGGQIGVHSEAGKGSTFIFYVKARRAENDDGLVAGLDLMGTQTPPASLSRAQSRDGVLNNPSMLALSHTHSHVMQRRPSLLLRGPPPLPKTVMNPQTDLHVLVVEDNEINQRVMANQLRRLGCTVHIAQHGLECLEFLETTKAWSDDDTDRRLPTGLQPLELSVVLMDLEMPVLGGLECIKRIRELQHTRKLTRHVPVIAVTANARSEQMAEAMNQGMDLVVTKPFRIPELVPQMEKLVARIAAEGALSEG